jgi:hypothetical protein
MASRRFQVIVTGTKIGFAVKLRSVSRKCTKEWIATVRDLCIDFDIGGQANLTSTRASDAIPAPSVFISTLPGKYQVLLRTDCKTLERQEGTPKLLSITIESAPFGTDCKRVLRLPGFRNCRYDPAYPVTVKYPSDSTWTPGDFRPDIAAANAMLLPCSIPSRKRSGEPTNSAHDCACFVQQLPRGRDTAIGRILASEVSRWATLSRCLMFAVVSKFPPHFAKLVHARLRSQRRGYYWGRILISPTLLGQTMPPLEVNQSTHISASVRLDESTAEQVNQYAAFIHTFEADVVGKAVNSCLRERPRLPNALEALQVKQAALMLRIHKGHKPVRGGCGPTIRRRSLHPVCGQNVLCA